jgi:hypothetical protein
MKMILYWAGIIFFKLLAVVVVVIDRNIVLFLALLDLRFHKYVTLPHLEMSKKGFLRHMIPTISSYGHGAP